jgi:hypothetical protein
MILRLDFHLLLLTFLSQSYFVIYIHLFVVVRSQTTLTVLHHHLICIYNSTSSFILKRIVSGV